MAVDKKAIAAMIVGNAKKPAGDGEESPFPAVEGEDAEEEMGLDVAVDDMLAAFQASDPALLKEALKSFITQYS